MKWTSHIDHIVRKTRKKLGLLRRQSQNLTTKQKIDIYKTMIRPILEYGSIIFDNCSTSDSLKLESCQRTAALICSGAMRRTETKVLLEHLEWDTLADRRTLFKTTLFYKIMRRQTPPYLFRNLIINQPSTRNLRNHNEIKPPRCRLELYKKSFFPNCIAIWNNLPDSIKNSQNIPTFKKHIKIHLNIGTQSLNENSLDHIHDGLLGKILTQIKLKLSPLRSHLFNYNLTDNPFCPACKDSIETPLHFFTECIAYRTHRNPMLTNLLELNPKISSPSELLDFIVNGSETGSHDNRVQINKSIFRHVSIFMFKTKRFTTID